MRNVRIATMEQQAGLPDDVDALKALVLKMRDDIAKLEHNVEVYKRLAFGAKSERRAPVAPSGITPNQGHLFYADLASEAAEAAERNKCNSELQAVKPATSRKTGGRRRKFPEHLPTLRTTYSLAEGDRACRGCGGELHEIGVDIRRELERIEVTVVHEIACQKYACRSCEEGVRTAPGPDRVIDKGLLGKGFLAHVLVERFGNHMPYYRLEKKYASEGVDLSRSVLQRSMSKLGELLKPIAHQLKKEVIASDVIFTDDTPVTIAQDSNDNSRKGRVWIYLDREGRHFYDFTETRERDGPGRLLGDYKGYIHADAYPGYDQIFLPGAAVEVACWAHARRKFIELESSFPELSKQAVDLIRKLYAIEKEGKGLDDDARTELRRAKSQPTLDEIQAWLELASAQVLPKSQMAQAIGYVQRQWRALCVFATDGRLSIDNNAAERALRPFAIGRKNWLFFQRDTGGETAVILASLLRTALAANIDPQVYFRDVLLRIGQETDVAKLTPHAWKENFAAEVQARRDEILQRILGD